MARSTIRRAASTKAPRLTIWQFPYTRSFPTPKSGSGDAGRWDNSMSSRHSTYTPRTGLGKWIDARMPLPRLVHASFIAYPVPRNLNYAYTFGGILAIMLVAQILTGVVLAMHYT